VRRLPAFATALLAVLLIAAPAAAAQAGGDSDEAVVVVNGDVAVERGEVAEGVFIVNGDARIAGRIDGDVVLVAGDVVLAGRVDGNLVTVAGRARLLPTASVGGDLVYGDERPLVAPAATVEGEIQDEDWTDSVGLLPFIGAFVFWLAISISAAVLGILLLLIAPRAADSVFEQARTRIGTGIGIGIAIFIVLPLASFLAAITLVGLPLALALGLAMLPLAAVAYVAAAWALGRMIVKPPQARILSFLAGLAILRLAALVPILGALVSFAAVIVGLGLLGGAIAASREPRGAPPAQPGRPAAAS
jgi:cytoskeletal protein CcmA (bactofilin family)